MTTNPAPGPPWQWVGADSPKVRVAGHSHMLALRYSMSLLAQAEQQAVAVFDALEQATVPDDDYWRIIAREASPVVILWGGNQHNVVFMMSNEPITVVGPRGAVSEPIGRVIPYSMVKSLWNPWLADLKEFLAKHVDASNVTLLGTPPPKAEGQIRAGIAIEPHFGFLLSAQGLTADTAPIVDTSTRVATWDALQERMAEIANGAGAGFLPVPLEVMADDGTLLPELAGPDATHANPAYGIIMWRHLLREMGA
jgi:hypothetical protein